MSEEMTLGAGLAAADAKGSLPHGTWVARVNRRDSSLNATNARERGELLEASLGSVYAVFAGTLHSRSEWAYALDVSDARSDAELLARAYVRWGTGLLDRVRGIFALAVWDREAETFLTARDPMGLYPLFYSEGAHGLLVSNSIDALTRQPDVPGDVNLPAIVDHLRHRWPYAQETFFEKVKRVPAGHALESKRGGLLVWRYWDPLPPGMKIDWVQEDDLGQFDELLQQAVERCRGERPAGIFLSGGLDSVSIAAVAASSARANHLPDPLALSLTFPVPEVSEEVVQRSVASALGMHQVELGWDTAVGEDGLVASGMNLSAAMSTPLQNLWTPAYDRLALEGKALGCEVILTGTGGDEWLTVSPYYAADLMRRLDVNGLARLFTDHVRSFDVSPLLYLKNVLWRFGARPVLAAAVRRGLDRGAPHVLTAIRVRRLHNSTAAWLAPDPGLRSQVIARELDAWAQESEQERAAAQADRGFPRFYAKEMRTALDHPLVAMEMEETFDQGRRLDMRIHQPFWDAELVHFLCRTPPELLNRHGRSKALVRNTVARRFPTLGFQGQRKLMATAFARDLLLGEQRRVSELLGAGTALEDAGVVHGSSMRALLRTVFENSEAPNYGAIWDLVTLECWLRAHR
jgi:asparagine synthetase B (glutamine-hydrolysing)